MDLCIVIKNNGFFSRYLLCPLLIIRYVMSNEGLHSVGRFVVFINSDGTPVAAVPRLRLKIDSGIAVASVTKHIPELSKLALDIAGYVGIRYVANVQFKRAPDGQYKVLEINPRFPGTLPLTTAAGVDMPKLLIADLNGEKLTGLMSFKSLMTVRYLTECYFDPIEWEALCQTRPPG